MRILAVAFAATMTMLAGCATPTAPPASEPGQATEVVGSVDSDVAEAVISSLRFLQWDILEKSDSFVIAKATHKERSATAKIVYTDTSYSIEYVDSEKLNGGPDNHVWLRWAHALDSDIRAGLGLPPLPG